MVLRKWCSEKVPRKWFSGNDVPKMVFLKGFLERCSENGAPKMVLRKWCSENGAPKMVFRK